MNADGTGVTRLTFDPSEDLWPSWSPDDNVIAFLSNRDGNWEVYKMNTNGSSQINLTRDPAIDGRPAWSGDGTEIAFYSNRDGRPGVYVMDSDGASPIHLAAKITSSTVSTTIRRGPDSPGRDFAEAAVSAAVILDSLVKSLCRSN